MIRASTEMMLRRLIAACALMVAGAAWAAPAITVYKDPNCGCCVKWVDYLREEGFEVQAINTSNLTPVKQKAGVPPEMASCHTAMVEGYVIEGHVPAGAIRKLLEERPSTRGLAVPGMPENSPGMGPMDGKLKTYTLEGSLYSTD
jgi:hypothetical protein